MLGDDEPVKPKAPTAAPKSGGGLGSANPVQALINKLPGDHPRPLPPGTVGDNRPLIDRNKTLGNVFELLNRPTEAAYAKHAGRGYFDTLIHGVDPYQAQADKERAYRDFPGGLKDPLGQAALDVVSNPLSVLGMPFKGRSLIARAGEKAEEHAFPAVVKAGEKVASTGKVGQATTNTVAKAHDFFGVHSAAKRELAKLHGKEWLNEYAKYRAMGMEVNPAEDITAQINKHLAEVPAGPERDAFVRSLERAHQGMSFSSSRASSIPVPPPKLYRYQKTKGDPEVSPTRGGTYFSLDKKLASEYDQPLSAGVGGPNLVEREFTPEKVLDVGDAHPSEAAFNLRPRSEKVLSQVGGRRDYQERYLRALGLSPEEIQKISISGGALDRIASELGKRSGYDAIRGGNEVFALDRSAFGGAPQIRPGELLSQQPLFPGQSGPGLHPPGVEMAGKAGPATARASTLGPNPERLEQMATEVGDRLGARTPEDARILKLMERKPKSIKIKPKEGEEHDLGELISKPSDFLTGGLFSTPFGHMANIGGLGLITDPGAVVNALGRGTVDNAKKLVGKGETDAQIAERHAPAQRGGAISSHDTERKNPFAEAVSYPETLVTKVPGFNKLPPAVQKATKNIVGVGGKLYKWSGDTLWKFDDEVKAQRFKTLTDGGMNPQRAGLRVGAELVDYGNKSPFAAAIRPGVPFATWRTKAPLAVGRGAIENPGRIVAASSLAPAMLGGTQGEDKDSGQTYTSSLPGAELAELASGPQGAAKYAVASMGGVPRLLGDAAGAIATANSPDAYLRKKARTQYTYGQEPWKFALNQIGILGPVLNYTGNGLFNKTGDAPTALQNLLDAIRVHQTNPR